MDSVGHAPDITRNSALKLLPSAILASLFLSLLTNTFLLECRLDGEYVSKKLKTTYGTFISLSEEPLHLQRNVHEKDKTG
jgi:hypothetical protein